MDRSTAPPTRPPAGGRQRAGAGKASDEPAAPGGDSGRPFLRVGRYAWAALGIVGALAVAGYVIGRLHLVVVPLVLALFPAALLAPLSGWLRRHGLPPAVAALLGMLSLIAGIALTVGVLVPIVASEAPELARSLGEGVDQLDRLLARSPLDVGGVQGLLDRARSQLGQAEGVLGGALGAVTALFEAVAGLLFGLVALFFYLKDGDQLAAGIRDVFPPRWHGHVTEVGARAWDTLGRYFRGQLLVALVDAVLIGIGLVVIGVPLAVPLAVLVFFGGLFPILGAVVSGGVAVLVALADAGAGTALLVLGLVVAVQQTEGNVLQPLVLGNAVAMHPLMVLVSLSIGAVTLGVAGAFLAVPVAASIAKAVAYAREQRRPGEVDRQADADADADDDADEDGDAGPITG